MRGEIWFYLELNVRNPLNVLNSLNVFNGRFAVHVQI